MNVVQRRAIAALLTDASSPQGVSHRRSIDTLATFASGWLGRRRLRIGHPHLTRSTV